MFTVTSYIWSCRRFFVAPELKLTLTWMAIKKVHSRAAGNHIWPQATNRKQEDSL
jgi:hypothetical protein